MKIELQAESVYISRNFDTKDRHELFRSLENGGPKSPEKAFEAHSGRFTGPNCQS